MEELIQLFLDDLPRQLQALHTAIESHDSTTAALTAHRLKGASGNVGAEAMSALCQRMEQSGRNNRLDELPKLLQELDDESARVQQFLSDVRKGQP